MALRFQDLEPNLLPETLKAIDAFGFDRMTPVQNAAIPLFLQNKDVCVEVSWVHAVGARRVQRRSRSVLGAERSFSARRRRRSAAPGDVRLLLVCVT